MIQGFFTPACSVQGDGKIETREGHGQFVKREANAPVNKALSAWKELTAPRPVSRSGIPATGV